MRILRTVSIVALTAVIAALVLVGTGAVSVAVAGTRASEFRKLATLAALPQASPEYKWLLAYQALTPDWFTALLGSLLAGFVSGVLVRRLLPERSLRLLTVSVLGGLLIVGIDLLGLGGPPVAIAGAISFATGFAVRGVSPPAKAPA